MKKHNKLIFKLTCLFVSTMASLGSNAQSFNGIFQFTLPGTSHGGTFYINNDSTYKLYISSISPVMSEGTWRRNKNRLLLTDRIFRGFNISVKESLDTSVKQIRFNYVYYKDSFPEGGSNLIVNNDNKTRCHISSDKCTFKIGSINNFKISYGGQFTSVTYTVQSMSSNIFDVIIEEDFALSTYKPITGGKIRIVDGNTIEFSGTHQNIKHKGLIFQRVK